MFALDDPKAQQRTGRWMKSRDLRVLQLVDSREQVFGIAAKDIRDEEVLYMKIGVYRGTSMRMWSICCATREASCTVSTARGSTSNLTPTQVIAALLHDTIENTATNRDELTARFGSDVADLVAEVTDDKSLPKAERKPSDRDCIEEISTGAKHQIGRQDFEPAKHSSQSTC